jgi:DNA polymerase
VYVTNAVKHFSFVYRGKRRLHAKPHVRYVRACAPWLQAELDAVGAPVIVCLGATAAQALLGSSFALTRNRGRVLAHASSKQVIATYHPSAALRAPDAEARHATYAAIVDDLKLALQTAQRTASAAATRDRRRTGS